MISKCDQLKTYDGQVCSEELTRWQNCFSPQADYNTEIYILPEVNLQEAEDRASLLLAGLALLSPSEECDAAIRPFLCLYLFGSCDMDNQPHHVSRTDCERLRDDICTQEWAQAEAFLGRGVLPDCYALTLQINECSG